MHLRYSLGLLLVLGSSLQLGLFADTQRPNIVLIFADDLGINDLSCYGREDQRTPNLDRLATQGMRFTTAYCDQPICSPSRAALMTGKCPARLHMTNYLPGRADAPSQKLIQPVIEGQLPLEEITIAELLKRVGYATGLFGKWHLGGPDFSPLNQGFDVAEEFRGNSQPSTSEAGKNEYATTAAAEKFIRENCSRPFFCYVPHNNPHIPLAARDDHIERNRDAFNPVYAAMIETLDDTVGQLMQVVDELGITEKTIFIFTSDNGGLHVLESPNTPATHNTPFRAGKGYLYEGGLREPLIIRWPGVTESGAVCDVPVVLSDLMPTLLEAAGIDVAKTVGPLDGKSLVGLLNGRELAERTLFWHIPNYTNQGGRPAGALRKGDWKLIENFEDNSLELYDLVNDASETTNLADSHVKLADELHRELVSWRARVGAQMPIPNPDFDRALHQRLYIDQDPSRLIAKNSANETATEWQDWRTAMNSATKGNSPRITPASGDIRLHAKHARLHSKTMRYEPQSNKNVLGFWTDVNDWAEWEFEVHSVGAYEIEIQQGCGEGSAGAEVQVEVAGERLKFIVVETGHFQSMIQLSIGEVELDTGKFTLSIKPISKPGQAVMDLRRVVLRPVH